MTTEVLWKFPVFMDLRTHGPYFERMVFELFYDRVPFIAEIFMHCVPGFSARTEKHLCYRRCIFLPVNEGDSYVKGGAICYETGEGRESIFLCFPDPDESDGSSTQNKLKHNREGLLSISKRDLEVSNFHFVITLKAYENLDSSHVVFGKLVEGWGTLQAIRDYIRRRIEIINCGMLYNPKHIGPNVIVRPCQSDVVLLKGRRMKTVQLTKSHLSQNQSVTKSMPQKVTVYHPKIRRSQNETGASGG